jgi:hypothetical protein
MTIYTRCGIPPARRIIVYIYTPSPKNYSVYIYIYIYIYIIYTIILWVGGGSLNRTAVNQIMYILNMYHPPTRRIIVYIYIIYTIILRVGWGTKCLRQLSMSTSVASYAFHTPLFLVDLSLHTHLLVFFYFR